MATGSIRQETLEKTQETKEKVKTAATTLGERAGEIGSGVVEKVGEAVANAGQWAGDTAKNVGHKVQETTANTIDKADQAIATLGERCTTAGESLRRAAPSEGAMGSAAAAVADNLQAGGTYLQQNRLEDMVEELISVIRRHPLQAVCAGIAAGYFLAAALKVR